MKSKPLMIKHGLQQGATGTNAVRLYYGDLIETDSNRTDT